MNNLPDDWEAGAYACLRCGGRNHRSGVDDCGCRTCDRCGLEGYEGRRHGAHLVIAAGLCGDCHALRYEEELALGVLRNAVACWPTAGPKERAALVEVALGALDTLGEGPARGDDGATEAEALAELPGLIDHGDWWSARRCFAALSTRCAS